MENENDKKIKRPPIIVVVGHVDHGKTSLLDYIRKTNVALKEAGGITQSIGAYEITHNNQRITFIDTPGHEAFSKMRERGTKIADIAILVIAADEGIKPQTKEALKVLQDSQTPFVIAFTKIDKPNANIEKIKNDLTANNVFLEGYGGNTSYQGVSSKTGEGIKELLDFILLAADMEELAYNPENKASGAILEVKMDSKRGNTVTIILKDGTLKKGDLIATPTAKGKIQILENFLGKQVSELSPSSPAVVLRFETLPQVGEEFLAGQLSEKELESAKEKIAGKIMRKKTDDKKTIKLVLKADVSGSLEALHDLIAKMPLKEGQCLEIINKSVGEITDNDVKEAFATQAIIIGFKTSPSKAAENLARVHEIIILTDEIIYKLIERIEELFKSLEKKMPSGELEILSVFSAKANKQTIGGKVNRGQIRIKAWAEIQRNLPDQGEKIIGKGKILNIQQEKKDVNAVNEGNLCGLIFESDIPIQVSDKLLIK